MSKVSPYTEFKYWLLDGSLNSSFPEHLIPVINNMVALAMFARIPDITEYLNSTYNNYELMNMDKLEFFITLKRLIMNKNIGFNDFSFIRLQSIKGKEISTVLKRFPYLKKYDAEFLIEELSCNKKYDNFNKMFVEEKLKINKIKGKSKKVKK